ncbi:hypothetical protein ABT061_45270 [Streptosporangium sp. NPDC002544]|uniref:hypothetical protein n=1 Tax=Streptosporangium sp. NPDC002544 TaxID=3154538 RepID=UPI0033254FCF
MSTCAGRVAIISGAGRGRGRCHAVAPVACTRMTSDPVTDPRAVDEPAPEQVSPVVTWLAGADSFRPAVRRPVEDVVFADGWNQPPAGE